VDPHRRGLNISLALLVGFFLFFLADRVAAWHMTQREAAAAGRRKKAEDTKDSALDEEESKGSFFSMASSGMCCFSFAIVLLRPPEVHWHKTCFSLFICTQAG
jgi:hypothetical protein